MLNLAITVATAVSWVWGIVSAFCILFQFVPPVRGADVTRAFTNFLQGFPAFFWLFLHYYHYV